MAQGPSLGQSSRRARESYGEGWSRIWDLHQSEEPRRVGPEGRRKGGERQDQDLVTRSLRRTVIGTIRRTDWAQVTAQERLADGVIPTVVTSDTQIHIHRAVIEWENDEMMNPRFEGPPPDKDMGIDKRGRVQMPAVLASCIQRMLHGFAYVEKVTNGSHQMVGARHMDLRCTCAYMHHDVA